MISNKVQLVLMVLLISSILISTSEPIFLSTAKAGSSSSSPGLGLMAYVETGEYIDLDKARTLFKYIEVDDPNQIIGTLTYYTSGSNTEDITMLISDNGFIAVGYPYTDPAGKIISWGSDKIIYNNFLSAMENVKQRLGINIDMNDIKFYHDAYPDANRILYATQSIGESFIQSYSYGSLQFNIPSDATIYEVSYSLYLNDPYNNGVTVAIDQDPMVSTMNNGAFYGFYNGYISNDVNHLLGIMSGMYAQAAVTMVIVYKDDEDDSTDSQSIMVESADSYTDKGLIYPEPDTYPTDTYEPYPTDTYEPYPTPYPTDTYEPYPTDTRRHTPLPTEVTPVITMPMPTAVPMTVRPTEEIPSDLSVWITSEKTENVELDEDAILKLSAVSLITKPKMMVQVIIMVPSGVSVTASDFSQSGTNQYTSKYELQPGDNKHVEVKLRANQPGTFNVKGRIVYYFGDDPSSGKEYTKDVAINVVPASSVPVTTQTQPVQPGGGTPKKEPGFEIIPGIGILMISYLYFRKM